MVIRFACPEGHPLTASEELIGKAGKCPKCEAKFLVPDPNEDSHSGDQPSPLPDVGSGSSANLEPATDAKTDDDEIIVFLCPEGHKLNGPKRMQGQAGQCPHCGAKFRIPSYDDEDDAADLTNPELADPEIAEPQAMPTGAMLDHSELEGEITEEVEELDEEIIEVVDDQLGSGVGGSGIPYSNPLPPPTPGESSLAAIFAHLWRQRCKDTSVYVYLDKGEVIEPARFSPTLSQRDYAVFAIDDEELSFRLISVPWDSVTRVDFSRIEDLPEGLFE
jgi:hypothetical protein